MSHKEGQQTARRNFFRNQEPSVLDFDSNCAAHHHLHGLAAAPKAVSNEMLDGLSPLRKSLTQW